ncbi:MAG TPA: hypothetical protein VF173_19935 [Thermoanaerobaculia bacterium]|nr:hypothetical protein [Thermoanaerobaculia bacterium]
MSESKTSPTPPEEPASGEQHKELSPGTREWRIRKALEAYQNGEGTITYAAHQAELSLREMIPLAYSYELEPKVDPHDFEIHDPRLL